MLRAVVVLQGLVLATLVAATAASAQSTVAATELFAKRTYAWWGNYVSADAGSVTVKVPAKDAVFGYVADKFKPGESVVLTWTLGGKDIADMVLYVEKFEVMQASKVDVGYILPVEFVSADAAAKTLTVKAAVPAAALQAAKGLAADASIKVTTPMHQPKNVAMISAIEAAPRPEMVAPTIPELPAPPPRRDGGN
ncbi:MAG: hypothetical protein FJW23_16080 [Acidimicrobiia bacterium]|nr:hypothetical protein [Acidimicrobiia bacterium]